MRHSFGHWNAAMAGLALSAIWTLAPVGAQAAVEWTSVEEPSCDGGLTGCVDTAYMNTSLVGADSQFIGSPVIAGSSIPATFTSAFDAWNAANGDAWNLVSGGALNLTISAHIGLDAGQTSAGLSPVIFTIGGGNSSLLSQLVWTQALVINYTPLQGPLAQPIQTLDTFSFSQDAAGSNPNFPKTCGSAGGAACGPIYPFQYGSTLSQDEVDGVPLGVDPFYDAPHGGWPNASFDAITLLSTVSTATDTLTVYDGVSYGFGLSAIGNASTAEGLQASSAIPEASTWAMMLLGFAGLGFLGYRQPIRAKPVGGMNA